jgi:hypothetical protein
VAETQGQFGNPDEGEHLLLEAVTRRLVKNETGDAIERERNSNL